MGEGTPENEGEDGFKVEVQLESHKRTPAADDERKPVDTFITGHGHQDGTEYTKHTTVPPRRRLPGTIPYDNTMQKNVPLLLKNCFPKTNFPSTPALAPPNIKYRRVLLRGGGKAGPKTRLSIIPLITAVQEL